MRKIDNINNEIKEKFPQIKYFLEIHEESSQKISFKSSIYHVVTMVLETQELALKKLQKDFLDTLKIMIKESPQRVNCLIWRIKPRVRFNPLDEKFYTCYARYILTYLKL